jgi:NAD+ synthase (glutamine-hydrolysing)
MNRKEAKLIRVCAAIPKVKVANVDYNVEQIIKLVDKAYKQDVDVIVFPELCVTGYTCGDLFHQETLIEAANKGVSKIQAASFKVKEMIIIVGSPIREYGRLFNSAIVIQNGNRIGIVGKKYLPGYKEFYEERWFSEDNRATQIFKTPDFKFGIEICEDVWSVVPPSCRLVQKGAEIIFNLSASNELIGKHEYLMDLLKQQSARTISGYVYASSGYGESSQDVVYAGNAIIYENGKLLAQSERFKMDEQMIVQDIDLESIRNERTVNTSFAKYVGALKAYPSEIYLPLIKNPKEDTLRKYNGQPFVPKGDALKKRCQEILDIQVHALAKRLEHTEMKPVIGVSGGSDSTWALIVIIEAMKKLGRQMSDVIGVTMPGFATSARTKSNSNLLFEGFGITGKEIDIKGICEAELTALGHDKETQDITFENVQARTRTQILMNISNQEGGLVIGTGDLSELALGWCTYNADHMSMYGVNASIPKTLIKSLIRWYAEEKAEENVRVVLLDVLNTPVSPELTGSGAEGQNAQVTEDNIGPYELHDFFLYNMLRHGFGPKKILYLAKHAEFSKTYTLDELKKWLEVFIKRFFSQQFKRSCLPDGPKVGSISLSPRGDWRMPSDACKDEWFKQIKDFQ